MIRVSPDPMCDFISDLIIEKDFNVPNRVFMLLQVCIDFSPVLYTHVYLVYVFVSRFCILIYRYIGSSLNRYLAMLGGSSNCIKLPLDHL